MTTHSKTIGVGIIGGTGFGAGELLRLLVQHPHAHVASIVSRSAVEQTIGDMHPHLRSFYAQRFDAELTVEALSEHAHKVVFFALPHGESGKKVAEILNIIPDAIVIDLSGDLRLQSEAEHQAHYGHSPFLPEIRSKVAYGLPELFSESVRTAQVVSNPGCLATAAILALAPLNDAHVEDHCALHLATGSSGAGREPKPTTHHPVRHANFTAYRPLQHQHLPEIVQTLQAINSHPRSIAFVPHSLPVSRGILCSAFLKAKRGMTEEVIRKQFTEFYRGRPFVRILKTGCAELENVVGSNMCEISIAAHGPDIVIHVAIDNLVKGMAGQAIQNMNIRTGLDETTGLWFPSFRPF